MENDYSFLVPGEELNGDKPVKVTNLSPKVVVYEIPELHITREFRPHALGQTPDSKYITFKELFALSQTPGGMSLIYDNLLIEDKVSRKALGLSLPETENGEEIEPDEQSYDEAKVLEILNKGTEDDVLDMLDYGPERIAYMVKQLLFSINSYDRRKWVCDVMQWDMQKLQENLEWAMDDERNRGSYDDIDYVAKQRKVKAKHRRAGNTQKSEKPQRRGRRSSSK